VETETHLERSLDPATVAWLQNLTTAGPVREDAEQRLHALLLRACRAELGRRAPRAGLTGPDVDDLAHQAATDATLAVLAKLDCFRGESRFTTWAYAFAVFEVSTVLGLHWRRGHERVEVSEQQWAALPERFAAGPEEIAQARELVRLVRRAVDEELTPRQRALFLAVVVEGVPLDALVDELGTTRGAVYKTVFDARRKIRQFLDANGYPVPKGGRP
jgi:RNA polymerase sigma-70 factor (ECF subfamily)